MVKIYEVDTAHFDVPIRKGSTIVKVVLLEDYLKAISKQPSLTEKEVFKDHRIRF